MKTFIAILINISVYICAGFGVCHILYLTNIFIYDDWELWFPATVKGYIDIKFYGTSNGWYSTTAELYEVTKEDLEYD